MEITNNQNQEIINNMSSLICCFYAKQMETCSSALRGQKRNLADLTSHASLLLKPQTTDGKAVTSDKLMTSAGLSLPPSDQHGDAQASEL